MIIFIASRQQESGDDRIRRVENPHRVQFISTEHAERLKAVLSKDQTTSDIGVVDFLHSGRLIVTQLEKHSECNQHDGTGLEQVLADAQMYISIATPQLLIQANLEATGCCQDTRHQATGGEFKRGVRQENGRDGSGLIWCFA